MKVKFLALFILLALAVFAAEIGRCEEPEQPVVSSGTTLSNSGAVTELELLPVPENTGVLKVKFVMKKLRVPHCKRGPERCDICRQQDEPRWCLLDVDPPDQEKIQRPVLEVVLDSEKEIRVYDVLRSFASEDEARQFLARSEYPGLVWLQD